VLGVPEGTVKSRLYHAREALRRLLECDRHG
jgi:DNA-directed RNA polymerase specialized sigma24 family protein